MGLPRKFLKFDYSVHILFGVLMGTGIVLIPITEGASILLLLWLWFIIGLWQVLSALILTIGYKNKLRAYYLLAVGTYVFSYFALCHYSNFYADYGICLSIIFAVWYGILTYKDATYRTPSFWDLEF